ncbi:MAG: hypothetical protein JWM32_1223 [Verrucomicrobia bacterium]|nr:hypothetical protein [Verrucomicrobiota bacterium]
MKFRNFLPLVLLALLAAGCSTIDSRIKEKSATFAGLDAPTQEKLRKGRVEVGYTKDMVYIALGQPDERKEHVTGQGQTETWIYTSTYDEYAGTAHVGYRRRFVRDSRSGATYVYLEPVFSDVYQELTEETIRIIFKDGRVEAMEESK